MPRRIIEKGHDFMAGPHSGVGSDIDGRVFPADVNLLPDPRWKDIDQYGWLVGWEYPAYPLPVLGVNVYARPPGGSSRYRVVYDSGESGFVLDQFPTTPILPPAPSMLKAPPAPVADALTWDEPMNWGFSMGWYGVAYALGRRGKKTGISPRFALNHDYSYDTCLTFSTSLNAVQATQADNLYIYCTPPQEDEDGALSAEMHLLVAYPLNANTAPSETIVGPLRVGGHPVANEMYNGVIGPVSWSYKPVRNARLETMDIDLAWRYRTTSGQSAQQPSVRVQTTAKVGQAVAAKPPQRPRDGRLWWLEWRPHGVPGQWLANPADDDFDRPQFVYGDDFVQGLSVVDATLVDDTGMPDPTDAPDAYFYYRQLSNYGVWSFSATAMYPLPGSTVATEERPLIESGPSAETTVQMQGAAARIDMRPPQGNVLHNPLGREREPDETESLGLPLGHYFDASVSGDVQDGVVSVVDDSSVTTLVPAVSWKAATVEAVPHVVRASLDFTSFTGGTVRLRIKQLTSDGDELADEILHSVNNGTDLMETEFVVEPESGQAQIVMRLEHEGVPAPRSLAYDARVEVYAGRVAPISGKAGGYVEVVDNPDHRPTDLDGIDLGMIEYFGAHDELLAEGAHPKGLKLPVRRNQPYVLSVYHEPTALQDGANLWSTAFFSHNGKLMQLNDPIAEYTGGSAGVSAAAARAVGIFTAPDDEDVAFFQILGSKLGRGRLRLWGMQWQEDEEVAAFDPGVDPDDPGSTTRTLQFVQDLGFVGTPDRLSPPGPIRNLAEVRGKAELTVVGEGILSTELRVGPSPSGPWGPTVTDAGDLEITLVNHFVQITVHMGVES